MRRVRQSFLTVRSSTHASVFIALACGLFVAAAATPGAPFETEPDDTPGCNGEAQKRAAPGPLGYSGRHDGGDPRCEGLYQRDVAADNLPEVAPMSLVLRARPFTPSDKTVIALAWPHVRAPVSLCARHTVDSILYRMDTQKQVGDTPDQPAAACDEFKWHTGVLEQVGKQYAGFDLTNLRVLAQVNVPLSGEIASQFPEAMRGKPLLLPLLVNAPDAVPAGDEKDEAKSVRLALSFHTNRELRDVKLRCTPLDPKAGQPIERKFPTVPRGVFAVRNLDLPPSGDYWMVELTFQFHLDDQWEQDRTLFYLMAPSVECAAWAAIAK